MNFFVEKFDLVFETSGKHMFLIMVHKDLQKHILIIIDLKFQ